MKKYDSLLEYQNRINNLEYIIGLLNWDLKVSTPKKSSDDLINLITSYEEELFKLETSDEYGTLLEDLVASDEFREISDQVQRVIKKSLKDFNANKNVPKDFYSEYTLLKNKSNVVWKNAKENNDYESFKPYLSKVIAMTKEYYRYIDPTATNLYDVMLDNYEQGMTSAIIDKLFSELKEALIPLIKKHKSKPKILEQDYSKDELLNCASFLLNYIGFDMSRGVLGIYPHGFTEKMSTNDVRIAFKQSKNPLDFVTTIIHEGGHGIFEQNISNRIEVFSDGGVNHALALHESQSRFFENILGRNKNFWIPIYDDVKEMLHLDLSLDEFVDALNFSTPSLIRTEADELTYCMHIILRYEIERDLFNNKISVDDLPTVWNELMKEYLGVAVDSDSLGLMQDVHWSEGEFGYFPDYLLGTIFDGMFKDKIENELGSIDDILKDGNIKKITEFLIDKIYRNGGAYNSLDLIKNICGKELTTEPIIKYFKEKYGK